MARTAVRSTRRERSVRVGTADKRSGETVLRLQVVEIAPVRRRPTRGLPCGRWIAPNKRGFSRHRGRTFSAPDETDSKTREAFFEILRRHRQPIDKARYLQRIVDRRGDRRTCGIDAGLAGALDAERIEWRRRILADQYLTGGISAAVTIR